MATTGTSTELGPERTEDLERVMHGGIEPVFQPIVDLDRRAVVGYEALARGPRGSGLESPGQLFGAARRTGCLERMDWACRWAAVNEARRAGFAAPLALFVNAEPEAMGGPHGAYDDWDQMQDVHCFAEITERALTSRPADLLRVVNQVRDTGWGVALDDVGANEESLALMPFLKPDVIKLDLRLLRGQPSSETVRVVHAVSAQAEATGAVVLAEGIETEQQLARALAFGARLGQGYRLGRPGPLPAELPAPVAGVETLEAPSGRGGRPTPFELVAPAVGVRRAPKHLLLPIARQLEEQAATLDLPTVVLASFEDVSLFTEHSRAQYAALAERSAFVGALGAGVGAQPTPGVRGGHLGEDDPVRREWDVAVVGAHFAAALVARDLGDRGPDMDRRFDFAVTFDRDLVVQAARSLMSRISPLP